MISRTDWTARRGFRILGLTHGLASNNPLLIYDPVYFEAGEICSQITNWEKLEPIEYETGMDSYCYLEDDPNIPMNINAAQPNLLIQGDISRLEAEGGDKRFVILGNMGIWFRFILAIQEIHGIYSLHASAIYKPEQNELLLIAGKAGAGKTVFLLESILRGYQIFSTEMTYFNFSSAGIRFLRGALMDNIRIGAFINDFPEVAERLGLSLPQVDKPWSKKISVDMRQIATLSEQLTNPTISIIFPRIEIGHQRAVVDDIPQPRSLIRMLFEIASEKIGATYLLYEELAATGLDSPQLAQARLDAISRLVSASNWEIKQARTTLAGPKSCLEEIDT